MVEGYVGTMESLPERINKLRKEGYTEDFNLKNGHLDLHGKEIASSDFKVDNVYRFDEMSDPADQSILYAISSDKLHAKGILIEGYGTFNSDTDGELVRKLRETH